MDKPYTYITVQPGDIYLQPKNRYNRNIDILAVHSFHRNATLYIERKNSRYSIAIAITANPINNVIGGTDGSIYLIFGEANVE
jgi:hypothetical protein